jgi:hypothetical protein
MSDEEGWRVRIIRVTCIEHATGVVGRGLWMVFSEVLIFYECVWFGLNTVVDALEAEAGPRASARSGDLHASWARRLPLRITRHAVMPRLQIVHCWLIRNEPGAGG